MEPPENLARDRGKRGPDIIRYSLRDCCLPLTGGFVVEGTIILLELTAMGFAPVDDDAAAENDYTAPG